jgi:hypothetical protein
LFLSEGQESLTGFMLTPKHSIRFLYKFDTTSSNDKIYISGGIFKFSSAFKRSVMFNLLAEDIFNCLKNSNENQTPTSATTNM